MLGRLRHVCTPELPNAESLGLGCSESRKGLPKSSRLVGLQDVEPSLLPSQECGCSRSPVAIPGQAQTPLSLLQGRDSLSEGAELVVALVTSTPWGTADPAWGIQGRQKSFPLHSAHTNVPREQCWDAAESQRDELHGEEHLSHFQLSFQKPQG